MLHTTYIEQNHFITSTTGGRLQVRSVSTFPDPATRSTAAAKNKTKLRRLSEDDFHQEVRLLLELQEPGGVLDSLHVIQDEIKSDFLIIGDGGGGVVAVGLVTAWSAGRRRLRQALP